MTKQTAKNELAILSDISRKIDDLIALTIVQGKDKDEKILCLVERGYSNSTIAELLGIPKGTVDSIRAKEKKNKRI